jgi:hypothetical protein
MITVVPSAVLFFKLVFCSMAFQICVEKRRCSMKMHLHRASEVGSHGLCDDRSGGSLIVVRALGLLNALMVGKLYCPLFDVLVTFRKDNFSSEISFIVEMRSSDISEQDARARNSVEISLDKEWNMLFYELVRGPFEDESRMGQYRRHFHSDC